MSNLYIFLSGSFMFGSLVVATFFLRFWKQSRDRLFLFFAIAFGAHALERVALLFLNDRQDEGNFAIYLLRLIAFTLILSAIIDKNRKEQQ